MGWLWVRQCVGRIVNLLICIGEYLCASDALNRYLALQAVEIKGSFLASVLTSFKSASLTPIIDFVIDPHLVMPDSKIPGYTCQSEQNMNKTQRPATTNVDLPFEIQRPIFEMAARSHRGAGFNLIQVAHYVYTWIEPILYEGIEILSLRSARSLLQTLSAKDRAFLDSTVRALAVSGDLSLESAKPIFVACSRGVDSFSAWGIAVNPSQYLPFIYSPHLRRLALFSNRPRKKTYDDPFDIPIEMLAMLTHIVLVSNFSYIAWDKLIKLDLWATSSASAASLTATPTPLASFTAFQNLTHFAMARVAWRYVSIIRKLAKKLRYFVILSQPGSLVYPSIIEGVRSRNDHRLVVVSMEDFSDWPQGDSRCLTTFWETVETLVSNGFLSDQGHKWPIGPCIGHEKA